MTDDATPTEDAVRALLNELEGSVAVDAGARQRTEDTAFAEFDAVVGRDGQVTPQLTHAGEFELVEVTTGRSAPIHRRGPVIMGVAACLLLLVGGMVVLLRDGDDRLRTGEDAPVADDLAPDPPVEPPPGVSWSSWAATTQTVDVLDCLVRVAGDQTVTLDVAAPNEDIPGFSEAAWTLSQLGPNQRMLDDLFSGRELTPARQLAVDAQTMAFAEADANRTSDEFDDLVADYLAAREMNPLLAGDPDACWLDRPAPRAAMAALALERRELQLLRCLSAETFDVAMRLQLDDPEGDHSVLVAQAGVSLLNYPDGDATELGALVSDAQDASLLETPDRGAVLEGVREQLRGQGLGLDAPGCRLETRA